MIAKKRLTPAAAYIRMSGDKQEKSPEQQRSELGKLAGRIGAEIVVEFLDEGIHGDSGEGERAGLADLLREAESGRFKLLLLWHTNRLSRQDPMDALEVYNRLRKAGVQLHSVCEGAMDLADFAKQLLVFVNQKASNDYLLELSAKVVRGQLANAKGGYSNGGPPKFALDRVLVGPDGQIVRRLVGGECVRMPGHRVKLVPCQDPAKLAAIRYAFQRFASADITLRALAKEMRVKGFPSPRGRGWTHSNVGAIIRNPAYCGSTRWGSRTAARYHCPHGDEILPVGNGNGKRCHVKPPEEATVAKGSHVGIVSVQLFRRVQAKLQGRYKARGALRADYPLSGLIVCKHCGKPMFGTTVHRTDGRYVYPRYICQSYKRELDGFRTGCGHFTIDAGAVQGWLVRALQSVFLGPGRDRLVSEFKRQLRATAKGSGADKGRLGQRLAELDAEVGRLVKAIRTTDIPELASELASVRSERECIKSELDRVGQLGTVQDIDTEAERLADNVWHLGEALADADPATLRELFKRVVSKIECRWQKVATPSGRTRCRLVGGEVLLRDCELWEGLSGSGAYVSA